MDPWHCATVAMLVVAFAGEVVGAFGKQRDRFHEESMRRHGTETVSEKIWQRTYQEPGMTECWWQRLWYGTAGFDRFPGLTPEFCTFARGTTRLLLVAFLVIHFACTGTAPWSPLSG